MQTALWDLQYALVQRFRGNVPLMNKITAVEDSVSATARKPYITIGEPTVTPHTTKSTYGETIVVPIHVWSDYQGKKECYDIFNLILTALKEPLPIQGSFLMLKREVVNLKVIDDPVEDGVKHGFIEMRFYINNN